MDFFLLHLIDIMVKSSENGNEPTTTRAISKTKRESGGNLTSTRYLSRHLPSDISRKFVGIYRTGIKGRDIRNDRQPVNNVTTVRLKRGINTVTEGRLKAGENTVNEARCKGDALKLFSGDTLKSRFIKNVKEAEKQAAIATSENESRRREIKERRERRERRVRRERNERLKRILSTLKDSGVLPRSVIKNRLSKIYSSESSISSKKSINEKKEKIYTEDDENLLWGPEDRYVELCTQISEIYVTDKKLSKLGKDHSARIMKRLNEEYISSCQSCGNEKGLYLIPEDMSVGFQAFTDSDNDSDTSLKSSIEFEVPRNHVNATHLQKRGHQRTNSYSDFYLIETDESEKNKSIMRYSPVPCSSRDIFSYGTITPEKHEGNEQYVRLQSLTIYLLPEPDIYIPDKYFVYPGSQRSSNWVNHFPRNKIEYKRKKLFKDKVQEIKNLKNKSLPITSDDIVKRWVKILDIPKYLKPVDPNSVSNHSSENNRDNEEPCIDNLNTCNPEEHRTLPSHFHKDYVIDKDLLVAPCDRNRYRKHSDRTTNKRYERESVIRHCRDITLDTNNNHHSPTNDDHHTEDLHRKYDLDELQDLNLTPNESLLGLDLEVVEAFENIPLPFIRGSGQLQRPTECQIGSTKIQNSQESQIENREINMRSNDLNEGNKFCKYNGFLQRQLSETSHNIEKSMWQRSIAYAAREHVLRSNNNRPMNDLQGTSFFDFNVEPTKQYFQENRSQNNSYSHNYEICDKRCNANFARSSFCKSTTPPLNLSQNARIDTKCKVPMCERVLDRMNAVECAKQNRSCCNERYIHSKSPHYSASKAYLFHQKTAQTSMESEIPCNVRSNNSDTDNCIIDLSNGSRNIQLTLEPNYNTFPRAVNNHHRPVLLNHIDIQPIKYLAVDNRSRIQRIPVYNMDGASRDVEIRENVRPLQVVSLMNPNTAHPLEIPLQTDNLQFSTGNRSVGPIWFLNE